MPDERQPDRPGPTYTWDVFLSHSSRDKPVVRRLAERLKKDGLRVWLDEWEIKPGDPILVKIEKGLAGSRSLVICLSANAADSDWATMEMQTVRFRDPLNQEHRWVPLKLDETEPPGSLAPFRYIDWQPDEDEACQQLLEFCLHAKETNASKAWLEDIRRKSDLAETELRLLQDQGRTASIMEDNMGLGSGPAVALSSNGNQALVSPGDSLHLWDLQSDQCQRAFEGHLDNVLTVGFCPNGNQALSGSLDKTLRFWDLQSGHCQYVLEGHLQAVLSVAISPSGRWALSGSSDTTLRQWDLQSGQCMQVLEGHSLAVRSVVLSLNGRQALSGSTDESLRLWDLPSGKCVKVLEGHSIGVQSVAFSPGGRLAVSSCTRTLRLWDLSNGQCVKMLERPARVVAFTPSGKVISLALFGDALHLWDLQSGEFELLNRPCSPTILACHNMALSQDGRQALIISDRILKLWDLASGSCVKTIVTW